MNSILVEIIKLLNNKDCPKKVSIKIIDIISSDSISEWCFLIGTSWSAQRCPWNKKMLIFLAYVPPGFPQKLSAHSVQPLGRGYYREHIYECLVFKEWYFLYRRNDLFNKLLKKLYFLLYYRSVRKRTKLTTIEKNQFSECKPIKSSTFLLGL